MPKKMDPYQLTDKAIDLTRIKIVRRFERVRKKINALDIDELNVIQTVGGLYSQLESDAVKAYLDLARLVYSRAEVHGKWKPDSEWLETAILAAYDPVSLYVFRHEVERKRDRTAESVIAAKTIVGKKQELTRAMKYWDFQMKHYADRVTDEARLKAYRDAGVKKVRWVTQQDEKVCATCGPRDGKAYKIGSVPPKPHYGCRCYLEPVID